MKRIAIVRGRYTAHRKADGGRTYQKVKGLANYVAYGPRQDGYYGREERGTWYDHNLQPHDHREVLTWAQDKVHEFGYDYSYGLLLSTRFSGLAPEHFNQALERGAPISGAFDWRFMPHGDTANQHAHAILFTREPLPAGHYNEWQQAMQTELSLIHGSRQLERAQSLAQNESRELAAGLFQSEVQALGLEHVQEAVDALTLDEQDEERRKTLVEALAEQQLRLEAQAEELQQQAELSRSSGMGMSL